MRNVQTFKRSNVQTLIWPIWPLLAILAVLFLGPLIAPLFQATGLPLIADSGALARDMLSRYICPTPVKSYVVLGFPMAVCARCWGATIGLWAAWFVFRLATTHQQPKLSTFEEGKETRRQGDIVNARRSVSASPRHPVSRSGQSSAVGRWSLVVGPLAGYLALAWPLRLALGALPFLLWVAEIVAWPPAPYSILLINGAFAGFWAGLFFGSIWPGLVKE